MFGQSSSASEWSGNVMRASLAPSLHYLLQVWQLTRCLKCWGGGVGSDFWLGCHWRLIRKSDPFVIRFFSLPPTGWSVEKKGSLLLHFGKQIIFAKSFSFINAPVEFPPPPQRVGSLEQVIIDAITGLFIVSLACIILLSEEYDYSPICLLLAFKPHLAVKATAMQDIYCLIKKRKGRVRVKLYCHKSLANNNIIVWHAACQEKKSLISQ